jgi:hypothetical protein
MSGNLSKKTVAGMLIIVAAFVGCFEFTGPTDSPSASIPYVRQETGDYCMPAAIQMSAKFHNINPPSQATLFANMHGQPGGFGIGGVEIQYIAPEMSRSGGVWDAVMDHMFFDNNDYYKRQISAAVQPSPVIALINQGYHGGVINGGQWHKTTNTSGEAYVWDQVKFHDPLRGPDQYYTADSWASVNCSSSNPVCYQALSNSAASNTANVTVVMYGGGGEIEREQQMMY